jgi:hypothetical protein
MIYSMGGEGERQTSVQGGISVRSGISDAGTLDNGRGRGGGRKDDEREDGELHCACFWESE